MSKPYSYDFRLKVLQAIELDGLKKSEANELFNRIHRTSIRLSDVGLGSKVEFASNSTCLIVYVMLWSMFYT